MPKLPYEVVTLPVGLRDAETRSRGHLDDHAGLVAVFGWRRTFDDFHGLNGIRGNLVREDLTLLIGDRLAIHGE